MYLDFKIFGNEEKNRKRLYIYLVPAYIDVGFMIYNHFNRGFLFYIADANQYYRGPGANLSILQVYAFLVLVLLYFCRHKDKITNKVITAILTFVLAPAIGSVLQMMAGGASLGMPGYTLAAFIMFFILEKDEMLKDPLTRLYTRSDLGNRLCFKLKSSHAFSVVLADLNDFKWINDTFGHMEGDRVLQQVSEILVQSTTVEDMVCRYGGDEFFLLIECEKDISCNRTPY